MNKEFNERPYPDHISGTFMDKSKLPPHILEKMEKNQKQAKNNQNTIKPVMNSESKAKFFAQYMFQRVLMWHDQSILYAVDGSDLAIVSTKKTQYFLLLTPLSDITDEDAIEVAKISFHYNENHYITKTEMLNDQIEEGKGLVKRIINNVYGFYSRQLIEIIDFLRSRGYAIGWMGYSVDELIEAGYLVLKKEGENEKGR